MKSNRQAISLVFLLLGLTLPNPGTSQGESVPPEPGTRNDSHTRNMLSDGGNGSGSHQSIAALIQDVPQVQATEPSQSAESPRYLTARSKEATKLMGDFEAFENRFTAVLPNRFYDRLLNLTWILPPDPKDSRVIARMNWDEAELLAAKLKARLPSLAEAKTLITRQHDAGIDAFINARFFTLNPRTKRCWTSKRNGLIEPYHRGYVDFAKPEWAATSMSEIYCVLLVESAGQ